MKALVMAMKDDLYIQVGDSLIHMSLPENTKDDVVISSTIFTTVHIINSHPVDSVLILNVRGKAVEKIREGISGLLKCEHEIVNIGQINMHNYEAKWEEAVDRFDLS